MKNLGIIITLFFFIFFISCNNSKKEIAEKLLNSSIKFSNNTDFNIAKLQLDSIITYYKEENEIAEKAIQLLKEIELKEQTRNLIFIDSLLKESEERLKPMLKNFIESDEYGTKRVLIHKRQRPENSYNRTYIRAHLDMDGNFHISSVYNGEEWINHRQIKVYYNNKSALSEVIKEDGFKNRRFEDGDAKWEIINYKDGSDNGIIDFIASNWQDPLRVQFIGQKYEYILMELFDREAVRDGYEISFVLKEIKRLEEEKTRITEAINALELPT